MIRREARPLFREGLWVRSLAYAAAAIGLTLVALSAAGLAMVPAALAAQPKRLSSCESRGEKTAFPDAILLGETISVTLHFNAVCPGFSHPLHIVFVLDGSAGMARGPDRNMRDAVETILLGLELSDNPTTHVGIVEFNSGARTLCPLMNNEERLLQCAAHMAATGGAAIDRGIVEGLKVLRSGRAGLEPLVEPEDALILVSEGLNDAGNAPVTAASRQARELGVLMVTLCTSRRCKEANMRDWASSARYFFQYDNASQIVSIFDKIRSNITIVSIRRLDLVDTIPPDTELIEASIEPPAVVATDKKTVTWTIHSVPKEGVTVTLRLLPLKAGYQSTNIEAIGSFIDNQNRRGSTTFPVPFVNVYRADRMKGAFYLDP